MCNFVIVRRRPRRSHYRFSTVYFSNITSSEWTSFRSLSAYCAESSLPPSFLLFPKNLRFFGSPVLAALAFANSACFGLRWFLGLPPSPPGAASLPRFLCQPRSRSSYSLFPSPSVGSLTIIPLLPVLVKPFFWIFPNFLLFATVLRKLRRQKKP